MTHFGERQAAGVSLVNVTKRFGEVEAVKNVSLEVQPGEFVSLLGPSGCGKTTTLRMIAGFEYPDEGDIRLANESIVDTPPHKRDTSMVFQDYALFPHRTVAQNVAFGLRMRKLPKSDIKQRVAETLELLELPGLGNRKPDQLSGGQQQRVALGRALIVDPSVLLLDEPLGALDLQLRKQMQLELKRIHRELGITFIYVTHDQEEAITMSDRIAVMNLGSVEQLGPVKDIYTKPTTAFVAQFIGDANLLACTVQDAGAPTILRFNDGGLTMQTSDNAASFDAGAAVGAVIRPENLVIGASAADKDNVYEMLVTDVIFAGPFVRILGEVAGCAIRLTTATGEAAASARIGDHTMIGWDAEDVVIIEDFEG
jgi:spermidine/putrescine ABC transporter ATP-binding subunit